MEEKIMKWTRWLPALVLALLFAGCTNRTPAAETTQPKIETLSAVMTEADIAGLDENYPDLQAVDFETSTCYAAIREYRNSHPAVKVTYSVTFGTQAVPDDTAELTLEPGNYDLDGLKDNLQYLPDLYRLTLDRMTLTGDQFRELEASYPDLELNYTVVLGDTVCDRDTESLNLSQVEPEQADEVASLLALLPGVTEIELMDGETAKLDVDNAEKLQDAAPQATLHYTFQLFGETVTTTDEEIYFKYRNIGDAGEPELRRALKLLRGTRVVLDSCKFTDEVLAQVREDFRDNAKVVWRVHFGKNGSCLTDREVIRAVYGLTDSNSKQLKYCEDARFLDFGHDEYLTDASFVATMPKLQAIILSGSMVKDLTPFENCKELEILELAYCGYLEDLSPLAGCDSLSWLNISYTKVTDLSPLDELPMVTLCATRGKVSAEEQTRFQQVHPECVTQFKGEDPYRTPWRYNVEGSSLIPTEAYEKMKEAFNYPNTQNTTW